MPRPERPAAVTPYSRPIRGRQASSPLPQHGWSSSLLLEIQIFEKSTDAPASRAHRVLGRGETFRCRRLVSRCQS